MVPFHSSAGAGHRAPPPVPARRRRIQPWVEVLEDRCVPTNLPPMALAGGPYLGAEGQPLALDASQSSDPEGDPLTFSWDLNNDGNFSDATGMAPTLSWAQLFALDVSDGPGTYQIRVRADDGQGNVTDSDPVALNLQNGTPALSNLQTDQTILNEGGTVTLSGIVTDPGGPETFTLTVAWGDNQTSKVTLPFTDAHTGKSFSIQHTYMDDFPDPGDQYTIAVQVSDGDGGTAGGQVFVTVHNVAPTLTGLTLFPDSAYEGQAVTLSGTFTDPALGQVNEMFQAEINWGDGTGLQTVDVVGGSFTGLTHNFQNTPGTTASTHTVQVRLTDDDGGEDIDSRSITILNQPPLMQSFTATSGVDATGQAMRWHPITFNMSFADPSWLAESGDAIIIGFDWNGDGLQDETWTDASAEEIGSGKRLIVTHTYDVAGTYLPTVTLTDSDGASYTGSLDTVAVNVTNNKAMVLDGNLIVSGTTANDNISINTTNASAIVVRFSKVQTANPAGGMTFNAASGWVIAYGGPGNDIITIAGPLRMPTELHGGIGNDQLTGGAGLDVLYGDAGNDTLKGLGGRDMLLGGLGRDVLRGGGDNDVLVGGDVNTTFNYQRLKNLADAWGGSPVDIGSVAVELTNLFNADTDNSSSTEYDQLYSGIGRDALLYRKFGVKDYADFNMGQDTRRLI